MDPLFAICQGALHALVYFEVLQVSLYICIFIVLVVLWILIFGSFMETKSNLRNQSVCFSSSFCPCINEESCSEISEQHRVTDSRAIYIITIVSFIVIFPEALCQSTLFWNQPEVCFRLHFLFTHLSLQTNMQISSYIRPCSYMRILSLRSRQI